MAARQRDHRTARTAGSIREIVAGDEHGDEEPAHRNLASAIFFGAGGQCSMIASTWAWGTVYLAPGASWLALDGFSWRAAIAAGELAHDSIGEASDDERSRSRQVAQLAAPNGPTLKGTGPSKRREAATGACLPRSHACERCRVVWPIARGGVRLHAVVPDGDLDAEGLVWLR